MKIRKLLLLVTLVVSLGSTSYSAQYSIQLLENFAANDINNQGQIAGYTNGQAAIWSAQGTTILGPCSDYEYSMDTIYINNSGQIVRYLDGSVSFYESSSASPSTFEPQVLNSNFIYGMNDHGDFVGYGPAYVWHKSNSSLSLLDGLPGGGINRLAYSINNAGIVCGSAQTDTVMSAPCAWINNEATQLQLLPGYEGGEAFGINESGNMVGRCTGFGMDLRACLWLDADSAPIDLGVPDGYVGSQAYGINNRGEIIGRLQSDVHNAPSNNPFIWKNGVISDLNTLISPDSGWKLEYARDINDLGQIVGSGYYNGVYHTYLMTPVPEPGSAVALLCGIGGLVGLLKLKKR